jgi:hypothetical protein
MARMFDTIKRLIYVPGSLDRMSNKSFLRLAIIVIILLLIFTWLSPYLIFGYNIISNSDEMRFFDRGKAIANGDVDLYHYWNNPSHIDAYPPAFSLIIAEMLLMNPGIDPYTVQFIYKAFIIGLSFLLYFWLGTFFSRKMALAAVFFRSCTFMILTDYPSLYTYLFPSGILIGGGNYTEIAVLLTIILVFRFLRHIGSDRTNLALIFLVGLAHGESHISGFMSFSIFFSIYMALYAALLSIKEIKTLLPKMYLLPYLVKVTKATFNNRAMMPIYITFLLPLLLHLTYYSRIVEEASPAIYDISMILPLSMPSTIYSILILTLFLLGVFSLIMRGRNTAATNSQASLSISTRVWRTALLLYLVCFIAITYVVNRTPGEYNYLNFAIMTGFPSYLPLNNMNTVSLLSLIAGYILFIMSLLGLIEMRNQTNPTAALLAILYLTSYYFFTFTFMLGILRPHRSMFFLEFIPILLGLAVINTRKILRTISEFTWRRNSDFLTAVQFLRRHSRQISAIIIVGFFAVSTFGNANMDPTVRELKAALPVLQFGNIGAPFVTPSFIEKIKEVYTPGEAILSSPDTQVALYAFLDFAIKSPYWDENVYDNSNYSAVFSSMHYFIGYSPSKWLMEHGGTLMIIGYIDILLGPPSYKGYRYDLQKFDEDPQIVKLYQDEFGERIYKLNVTG